jgi:hypothetical protein
MVTNDRLIYLYFLAEYVEVDKGHIRFVITQIYLMSSWRPELAATTY